MPTGRTATTRSLTRIVAPGERIPPVKNPWLRLASGSIVNSASSGRHYRVGAPLGAGGFGAVYEIAEISGGSRLSGKCVLKVTLETSAWHREAYFGDLLKDVPGVVQLHESFAWMPPADGAKPLYCLVSEHVEGGDLTHYLRAHPAPWTETKARREIVRLLESLRLLHAAGLVHRDITPNNVFVTLEGELKLGDFGIAAQRLGNRTLRANAFAPMFAPTAIRTRKAGAWLPADDVYHLGKLFALLLTGGAESKLTAAAVKNLACSPWAKSVIQRCIGERRKRFTTAAELLIALSRPAADRPARQDVVRSLQGKHVVFTGRLTMLRKDAARLLKRAGGIAQNQVGSATDIVVVGEQSPNWKAEKKGQKLLDLDHETERGHRIAVISEKRFRNLLDRKRK